MVFCFFMMHRICCLVMKRRNIIACFLTMFCLAVIAMFLQDRTTGTKVTESKPMAFRGRQTLFRTNHNTGLPELILSNSEEDLHLIRFTKMRYGPVYVLNAAAGNSSDSMLWDIFKIYASIDTVEYSMSLSINPLHFWKFKDAAVYGNILSVNSLEVWKFKDAIKCCLMYDLGDRITFETQDPLYARMHHAPCSMRAFHYTCPNKFHSEGIVPKGVSLAVPWIQCDHVNMTYIQPFYPVKIEDEKLVIGTKMAFGNISAELIIEWMETYKRLGVDKVVTYAVENINKLALNVLKYYSSTELLDLYYFEPASQDRYKRQFHPPNPQKWNDARMVIYDTFEKYFGYTYFGIIDHDEFLIPSRNRTLKQLMADLYYQHKNVTGFSFKTQFYYSSRGKTGFVNDLVLGTHTKRGARPPKLHAVKHIYKPNLVFPGAVGTHNVKAKTTLAVVHEDDAYIRHFRECRPPSWDTCMETVPGIEDLEMAEWSKRIQNNVEKIRQRVFGRKSPV